MTRISCAIGLVALAVPLAALLAPGLAAAQQTDVAAAAEAYSRAQQAELRGENAQAAELYGMADRIAPTREALRSAIRANRAAGHDARAAGQAEALLRRYPEDGESRRIAEQVLAEVQGELTRYRVLCAEPCQVLVDQALVDLDPASELVFYATPGRHRIRTTFAEGATSEEQESTGEGGERLELSFEPTAAAAEPPHVATEPVVQAAPTRRSRRVSPWLATSGIVLTVGLGAALTACAVRVVQLHDEYDPGAPDAREQYELGRDWEIATNVLIGVTAAVALSTLLVAVLATDWERWSRRRERSSARRGGRTLEASPDWLVLGWRGAFE